jgi:putative endonuclease
MSFWAYMLHCRGGYFYTGHTDNLEIRVAQHRTGAIPRFTADHLPIELVWSQEFPTRDEAKEAERRIKGWSRAKKLALIRGDWDRISTLAKAKGSPSTSSGKTGLGKNQTKNSVRPELVGGLSFTLIPHSSARPRSISSVTAQVTKLEDGGLSLQYEVRPAATLVMPDRDAPWRRDGLWTSTCFEVFVRPGPGSSYAELNFAPHRSWNAYSFTDRRRGMAPIEGRSDPHMVDSRLDDRRSAFPDSYQLDVILSNDWFPHSAARFGLSAVIEEKDGTKSYWALAHPDGPPDFHDPACFVATLPAIA